MPFAALADRIRPAAVTSLLDGHRPDATPEPEPAPDPPPGGTRVARCTGFVFDTLLVRVAAYTGDAAGLPGALARSGSYRALDRRVSAHLAISAGGAARTMRCVQQRIVRENPDAALAAIHYPVREGCADTLADIFTAVRPQARPVLRDERGITNGGVLHGVAVFVCGTDMVRVVSFTGELADVVRYMAERPGRREIERRMAPFLGPGALVDGAPEEFVDYAHRRLMTPLADPLTTG